MLELCFAAPRNAKEGSRLLCYQLSFPVAKLLHALSPNRSSLTSYLVAPNPAEPTFFWSIPQLHVKIKLQSRLVYHSVPHSGSDLARSTSLFYDSFKAEYENRFLTCTHQIWRTTQRHHGESTGRIVAGGQNS